MANEPVHTDGMLWVIEGQIPIFNSMHNSAGREWLGHPIVLAKTAGGKNMRVIAPVMRGGKCIAEVSDPNKERVLALTEAGHGK